MRIGWARGVVTLFVLGAVISPALAGNPYYKDVCASGCTYSSVQAAIDSITVTGPTEVYTIFIDSGVLQSDNSITTNGKDYINFVGRGMGVSVLQASSSWYSRAAGMLTGPDFFDFSGSNNVTVSNLTIDARTTDPGNVSTTLLFGGVKVDPGTGGRITFESCEVQGIFYAMWDAGLSDGLVEVFNSKVRGVAYAIYALMRWHIFSSELRAVDNGGASTTVTDGVAALLVYTEGVVWGSHLHAESAQPNQTYQVSGITMLTQGAPTITVIDSTLHVKMTTTSIGSSGRLMAAATVPRGTGNFVGTEFLYENTGALSQGKLMGLRFGATSTVNLAGCTFRDAGGSGGDSRTDIGTPGAGNPQVRVAGTRISSAIPLAGSMPAGVIKAISTVAFQRGVATFPGSNTAAVTLPVELPDTNYRVRISGSANETFWVTSKTATGFTLRSSKATSTATVDWSVTGCNFGSSSCGF